jgi:hypothetical protein
MQITGPSHQAEVKLGRPVRRRRRRRRGWTGAVVRAQGPGQVQVRGPETAVAGAQGWCLVMRGRRRGQGQTAGPFQIPSHRCYYHCLMMASSRHHHHHHPTAEDPIHSVLGGQAS